MIIGIDTSKSWPSRRPPGHVSLCTNSNKLSSCVRIGSENDVSWARHHRPSVQGYRIVGSQLRTFCQTRGMPRAHRAVPSTDGTSSARRCRRSIKNTIAIPEPLGPLFQHVEKLKPTRGTTLRARKLGSGCLFSEMRCPGGDSGLILLVVRGGPEENEAHFSYPGNARTWARASRERNGERNGMWW